MIKIDSIDIWEQEREGEFSTVEGELRLALSDNEQCGFNEAEIVSNCQIDMSTDSNPQFALFTHAVLLKRNGNPERIVLFYKNLDDFAERAKKVLHEFEIQKIKQIDREQTPTEPVDDKKQRFILSACSPDLAEAFARAAADSSCESEFLDEIVGWSLHPYAEVIVRGDLGDYQLEIPHRGVCQLVCKNNEYLIALQNKANADWKGILKTMIQMTFKNANTQEEIDKVILTKFAGLSEYDDFTWQKPPTIKKQQDNYL